MPVVVELWESLRSCPPKQVMVALVSKDILNVAGGGDAGAAEVEAEAAVGGGVEVEVVTKVKWCASCWRRLR